jgi:hypothetical protein
MRTDQLQVFDHDGNPIAMRMSHKCAVQSFMQGRSEQVFDNKGHCIGVMLREGPRQVSEEFHRGSLSNSPASITKSECMANAGLAPRKRIAVAREKVTSWPSEHDQNNVVISAGIAYGVYCPLFDTNVHTPNFA